MPERGPAIARQRWDSILFLHWPLPASDVRPLLPRRIDVDEHEGRAYVSIVAFTARGTRARFIPPLPGASDFHQVNLRTYVRLPGHGPGLWFLSMDAGGRLFGLVSRALLRLPFHRARISRAHEGERLRFRSNRAGRAHVLAEWRPEGPLRTPEPDSLEHFLTERYVSYAPGFLGKLWRSAVRHPRWELQDAREVTWRETIASAAGLPPLSGEPLARWSPGFLAEILPFRLV